MEKPGWFKIMHKWQVKKDLGVVGVTVPFLVGALAHGKEGQSPTVDDARALFNAIVQRPVAGFVTEASWCDEIGAPVLQVVRADSVQRMDKGRADYNASAPLVFGSNLITKWQSTDLTTLIDKLIEDARAPIARQAFSRNKNTMTGQYEYGDFLPGEISFIRETLK